MGDITGICLWCGRWANGSVGLDGLADCDRPECIEKRVYEDEFDLAAGIKLPNKETNEGLRKQ